MVRRHGMRDNAAQNRLFAIATASAAVGVLPVLLVGGLFIFISEDVVLMQYHLGLGVSLFFAAAAIASPVAGMLASRFGWKTVLFGGLVLSLASAVVLSGVSSWGVMATGLAIAGLGNGIVLVASNVLIAEGISDARQGIAFGAKQAAIPAASLLSGVAVSLATVGVSWRLLVFAAGPLALATAAVLSTVKVAKPGWRMGRAQGSRRPGTVSLLTVSASAAFASAGATTLPAFLVVTTVGRGMEPALSGVLLIVGSLLGVATRLALGAAADRHTSVVELGPPVAMLIGAGGFAVIAVADSFPLLLLGTSAAFVGGWGWTGLLYMSIAAKNRGAVAGAMGVVQAGMLSGGFAGPLLFGLVAESVSGSHAWLGLSLAAIVAAILISAEARRPAVPTGSGGSRARGAKEEEAGS